MGKVFPLLDYAPIAFITREGGEPERTLGLAQVMYLQSGTRLATGQLNGAVEEILGPAGPEFADGSEGEDLLCDAVTYIRRRWRCS